MKEIIMNDGTAVSVDDEDFERFGHYRWTSLRRNGKSGYAHRSAKRVDGKRITEYLHRLIAGALPGQYVDHINGDIHNSTKTNLRIATSSQNLQNSIPRKGCVSSFKGVVWHAEGRKWQAQINVESKYKYLGLFESEVDAAKAYDAAAKIHFGEFARLNFAS